MYRQCLLLFFSISLMVAPVQTLLAQTEIPTSAEVTNQALFEQVTTLKSRGATASVFSNLNTQQDIEALNWTQRAEVLKEVALASKFGANIPNPCSEFYTLGSVVTAVETDAAPVTAGSEKEFTIKVTNNNPYPIVDASVYLKVFETESGTGSGYPGLIDQFKAVPKVTLRPGETTTVNVTYTIPMALKTGTYEAVSYVSVADTFNVTGLFFTDDIKGGSAMMTVEGRVEGSLSFDRSLVFLNTTQYTFTALAPEFSKDAPIKVTVPVMNTHNLPLDATITWKLYNYDQQSEATLLETVTDTVSVGSKDTVYASHIVTDTRYPTYVLVGEMKYLDVKSLINIRFARSGVEESRITFAGVENYPMIDGGDITLSACVQSVGTGTDDFDTIVRMKVLDENGKTIHRYKTTETISTEQTLVTDTFSPGSAFQALTLETSLERNGEIISSVSTTYDCQSILGTACTQKGKLKSVFAFLNDHTTLALLTLFVLCILSVGFVRWSRRHRGETIVASDTDHTPAAFFIALLLGGMGILMPVQAEAQFTYVQDGSYQPQVPAYRAEFGAGGPWYMHFLAECFGGSCGAASGWVNYDSGYNMYNMSRTDIQQCETALAESGLSNVGTRTCVVNTYTSTTGNVGDFPITTFGVNFEIFDGTPSSVSGQCPSDTWPTKMLPTTTLGPGGSGQDSFTLTNYCKVYTFVGVAPIPNLTVTTPLRAGSVVVGQANNYTGRVTNIGTAGVSSGYNNYFVFYQNPTGTIRLSTQSPLSYAGRGPALGPGDSADVTGSFTLNEPGTYYYRLCTDWDNEISESSDHIYDSPPRTNCTVVRPLSVRPTQPTGFTYTCNADGTKITFNWDANPYAYIGYQLRLWNSSLGFAIETNDYYGTSITYDTNPSHVYEGRIYTASAPYNTSQPAVVTGLFTCRPNAPTNFAVSPGSCGTGQNNLSWDPVVGADGYQININGFLYTVGRVTSYAHTGLAPLSLNQYSIRAYHGGGGSPVVGPIVVNAPNVCNFPPAAPVVTGSTTVTVNTVNTYQARATDPDSNPIYYDIDWNADGTAPFLRVPGSGNVPSGTTQSFTNLWTATGSTTFWARAVDSVGAASSWTAYTEQVISPPNATALLELSVNGGPWSASDQTIDSTDTVSIRWTSTNATTCTGTGFNTAGAPNNAVGVVISNPAPTSFTDFSVTCTGAGAPGNDGIRVTTNALPLPIITLTSNINGGAFTPGNKTIISGDQVVMSWSATNAVSCSGINAVGLSGISGTFGITEPGPGTNVNYGVRCFNATLDFTDAIFNVFTPPIPTASLEASINGGSFTTTDQTVDPGDTLEFRWSSTDATNCSASAGPGFAASGTNGTDVATIPVPNSSQPYTVSCTGPGGSANRTITITTRQKPNFTQPSIIAGSLGAFDSVTGTYNSIDLTFSTANDGGSPTKTTAPYSIEPSAKTPITGTIPTNLIVDPTGFTRTVTIPGPITFGSLSVKVSIDTPIVSNGSVDEVTEGDADNTRTTSLAVPAMDPGLSITTDKARLRNLETATISWSLTTSYPNLSCQTYGPGISESSLSGSAVTQPITAKSEYSFVCTESTTGTTWQKSVSVETEGEIEEI